MKRFGAHVVLVSIAAGLLVACKDNATSETPPAASSAVAVTPPPPASSAPVASASAPPSAGPAGSAAPGVGGDRQAGVAGAFVRTARQLALNEDQNKQLDKILEPLRADDSMKAAMKQVHDDTVAGVKAGKMDMTKLGADYAAFDKAVAARHDAEANALNSLHKMLNTDQRKQLTAKMRDRQKERDARMAERKAKMGDAGAPDWNKRRVDQLTKELDLDADQQKKVEALAAKDAPTQASIDARMADSKKRLDALLTAFEKDDFDAKKIDFGPSTSKDVHADMEKRGQFYAALVPLLKPEQREKLVASLERPMVDRPHWGDQENE